MDDEQYKKLKAGFRDLLRMPEVIEKAISDDELFDKLLRTGILEYKIEASVLAAELKTLPEDILTWSKDKHLPSSQIRENTLEIMSILLAESLESD